MTVGELKAILDNLDDDSEIRLAMQPSWPFEYDISDVIPVEDEDATDEEIETFNGSPCDIVYLVEGRQIGYLPGHVSRELGWR